MDRIPKIIHYCWFSGDPMPQRIVDCIESWKTVLPDYELRLWDMERLKELRGIPWIEEALSVKKWAFVADYVRLYALYTHGGIYLDTDVRVIKSFDPFLEHRAFSGIEWNQRCWITHRTSANTGINIEFAIFASEKGHPVIGECLDYYKDRHFIVNGEMDMRVIPEIMTPIVKRFGFDDRNYWGHQVLDDDFHIYPYDYFPGQRSPIFDLYVSHNTVAIHLHTGSWNDLAGDFRRVHSPYTELRLYIKHFFRGVYNDVFWRKGYVKQGGKKWKKVTRHL